MDNYGRLGDKLAFGIFFLVLLIIGAGIVAGVAVFYGEEYSFRGTESELLAVHIHSCILEKSVSRDNFYEKCGLSKEVLERDFFISILENGREVFSVNRGEITACESKALQSNQRYLRCAKRVFQYAGKEYEILTGSNQKIRRSAGQYG